METAPARLKIGFHADPAGGPGIFLARLKAELERIGCFDSGNPDVWIELCYAPLPEAIASDSRVKKLIRTDGVYSYRYRLISGPIRISLPLVDRWVSRRANAKNNRQIVENLQRADGIVFQSEFSRRVTHRFATKTPPGVVVFNGVDTAVFCPDAGRRRDPRRVHILISHAYRPHKRLHDAVRIVGALKKHEPAIQWQLHVVGADDGRSFIHAEEVMRSLGLENEIVFHGRQPFSTLYELYRRCDFAFGLSFWDFCPNVIVEALSCGLPVVGVDFGGIPELVDGAGRLVEEEIPFDYLDLYDFDALPRADPDRYAGEVLRLLDDLEEYQALARERALNVLDIRLIARRYVAAAEALLS